MLLLKFKKVPSRLCSFSNSADEMLLYIFYNCKITKQLWNKFLFLRIFIFLKSLLRVPSLFSLILAFKNKTFYYQPFTTIFQGLSYRQSNFMKSKFWKLFWIFFDKMVSILMNIIQHGQYYLIILLIGLNAETLIKKRLWHRCFPKMFAKFLGTTFFVEHI